MKTQLEKLQNELLDIEGYPTEQYLDFIEQYEPDESLPIEVLVSQVIREGWYMSDWGFKLHRKRNGKQKLELHTGGWSGNEEIISAIKNNIMLSNFHMKYVMWRVGGHHYFEINYR